ncbi:hypothetical protein AVEN_230535-1 [Araneus ventricosus]|uniref:Uncharacterized protein n=1 Tax=Araneus ventricosus TaxID=182803 RepID=A0A4Y2CX40_ARAVE|nr:hypothetical protein AVEN_230535-1 [Araneus ventricosus]
MNGANPVAEESSRRCSIMNSWIPEQDMGPEIEEEEKNSRESWRGRETLVRFPPGRCQGTAEQRALVAKLVKVNAWAELRGRTSIDRPELFSRNSHYRSAGAIKAPAGRQMTDGQEMGRAIFSHTDYLLLEIFKTDKGS